MATVKKLKKTVDVTELFTADIHEKGAEMQVMDPYGTPLDMYITLAGIDSKTSRDAIARTKRAIVKGEDREQAEAEGVAGFTLGWRGFMHDGQEWTFTKERAVQLYTQAPYIREQADIFATNRANFKKS